MSSSSSREMACILQIWTGVLVGSRRSSMSWGVREGGGGRGPPAVRCADTSPGSPGEAKEGAVDGVVACSCGVVMRMAWAPWWLDGLGRKHTRPL